SESLGALKETHVGLGLLRVRVLGLRALSAKYGADSVVAVMHAAAQTLRHNLNKENFLGRWGEDQFLAVLQSGSPIGVIGTADSIARMLRQVEVAWWGDRLHISTEVESAIARTGDTIESLLSQTKPSPAELAARAAAGGGSGAAAAEG